MLLSPRKNGLTSLFKEVRVFKGSALYSGEICRASFAGRDGGVLGSVGVAIYEKPGFPNPGFRNL